MAGNRELTGSAGLVVFGAVVLGLVVLGGVVFGEDESAVPGDSSLPQAPTATRMDAAAPSRANPWMKGETFT